MLPITALTVSQKVIWAHHRFEYCCNRWYTHSSCNQLPPPPPPCRRGENYFYVKRDPYLHSPFHHLSYSHPLLFENFQLFLCPPFSLPESLHINPTSNPLRAALTPDHPVPGLLFGPRPLTLRRHDPLPAPFRCWRTPCALPTTKHSTATLSTSNLFSALATRP